MSTARVEEAVAPLRAGVDDLLTCDLTMMSAPELAELVRTVEVELRRLAAVDHRLLAEVVDRDAAGDYGSTSPTALLVQLLRVSPGEARARLARAAEAGPRHELSGEPLPPVLPVAAEAVLTGEISAAHLRVISACLACIPDELAAEATPIAEAFLVQAACHENPRALERTAEVLLLRLDPDGRRPREDEVERRRNVELYERADGTGRLNGALTAEATAVWRAIFDVLAAPVSGDEPDTRSAGQRRHDALVDVAHRLLRSGTLPAAGGIPLTVLLGVDLADVRGSAGPGAEGSTDDSAGDRSDISTDVRPDCPVGTPIDVPFPEPVDQSISRSTRRPMAPSAPRPRPSPTGLANGSPRCHPPRGTPLTRRCDRGWPARCRTVSARRSPGWPTPRTGLSGRCDNCSRRCARPRSFRSCSTRPAASSPTAEPADSHRPDSVSR